MYLVQTSTVFNYTSSTCLPPPVDHFSNLNSSLEIDTDGFLSWWQPDLVDGIFSTAAGFWILLFTWLTIRRRKRTPLRKRGDAYLIVTQSFGLLCHIVGCHFSSWYNPFLFPCEIKSFLFVLSIAFVCGSLVAQLARFVRIAQHDQARHDALITDAAATLQVWRSQRTTTTMSPGKPSARAMLANKIDSMGLVTKDPTATLDIPPVAMIRTFTQRVLEIPQAWQPRTNEVSSQKRVMERTESKILVLFAAPSVGVLGINILGQTSVLGCLGCTRSYMEAFTVVFFTFGVMLCCRPQLKEVRILLSKSKTVDSWLRLVKSLIFNLKLYLFGALLWALLDVIDPGNFQHRGLFNYAWLFTLIAMYAHYRGVVMPLQGSLSARCNCINILMKFGIQIGGQRIVPIMGRKVATLSGSKRRTSAARSAELSQKARVPAFQNVLDDPVWQNLFLEHMKSEYSQEGIMFYQAVRQFQDTFEEGSDETRRRQADVIYHTFLHHDAIMEVNVASDAEKEVVSAFNNLEIHISKTLFDKALAEVLSVMQRDNYMRFKKSAIARNACLNAKFTMFQTKSAEELNDLGVENDANVQKKIEKGSQDEHEDELEYS